MRQIRGARESLESFKRPDCACEMEERVPSKCRRILSKSRLTRRGRARLEGLFFGAEQGRGDLLTPEQWTHPDCRIALNRGLDAILLPVASRTTLQSAAQLETKRCLVTYIALFGLLSQSVLTAGVFPFSRFAAAVATSRSAQPFLGKSSAAPSERYSVLMSQRISGLRGMDGRLLPLCQRGSHHHDLH